MQLLSETGIFGTIPIIILFVYLIAKILNIRKKSSLFKPSSILLIGIFVNLWPLIPTGNFFNNWISMIYFIPISFYLFETNYREKRKFA